MSESKPSESPQGHDHIDALSGREALRLRVLDEALESRARLCFRSLSQCLAALVLVLVSFSLHAVITTFIDIARAPPIESLHAVPASFATDPEDETASPPATQSWPHAIVVVISILLIGEIVLAIGPIRATFSLRVNSDTPPSTLSNEAPLAGASLPGVELLKASTEALMTVIKGLPPR